MKPRYRVNISGFSYPDGTLALKEMEFEIISGECIGILGANGSGKTTLLKIMDGILKGYKGYVELDGEEIRDLTPRQIYSKVGLVFQDPDDQLFASTVYEDVAFGPLNMGFSEWETRERVKRALKDVEMEGLEDRRIETLSYGQKKRVCIAGLLAMGQEVLLMDEPLAGLDPLGELRMLKFLRSLNREKGVTMVIASHNVDIAPLLFDRVLVLNKGSIGLSGRPEEVFQDLFGVEGLRLRLPYIGELFWKLKNLNNIPFPLVALTVEQGRHLIVEALRSTKGI
ncbi:MAG: energy-coupling factor ABC transporter ATP-binding protein [Desulfatiglandales bacterium]